MAEEHSFTIDSDKILIEPSGTEIQVTIGDTQQPLVPADDTIILSGNWKGTLDKDKAESAVTVSGDVTANIKLNGATVETDDIDTTCAFEVRGNATVHLILSGVSTLKSGVNRAGLEVQTGNTLVISGSETGRNSLTARGGQDGAGIGGGANGGIGTILIDGGMVTATGGGNADIGPGQGYSGTAGTITITGGSVHPTTGANAVSPQPTDGTNNVYLNTLTVGSAPVAADKPITACSVDGQDGAYGVTDVYTDSNGALYFWLTEKADGNVTVEADGNTYGAAFARKNDNTTAETLAEYGAAISLDLSGGYDFGEVQEGYDTTPAAYTVMIENTGSVQLLDLSVDISGGKDSGFVLTPPAATSLDIGGKISFDVQPKGGLPASLYTGTVTVSVTNAANSADSVSEAFGVSFTVSGDTGPSTDPTIVSVEGVKLDLPELTLAINTSRVLVAKISPDNASDTTVTWSSDDPAVVSVDQGGRVTALSVGTATITATTNDGNLTATCVVTVKEPEPRTVVEINLSGLGLEDGVLQLMSGKSVDLTIAAFPSDATFTATGLPDGLTLSPDGHLSGATEQLGDHEVTLTAKITDGSTGNATFTIKVSDQEPNIKSSSGSCTTGLFGMGGLAILALTAATRAVRRGTKRS